MAKHYPKEFRDDVVAVARRSQAPLSQIAPRATICSSPAPWRSAISTRPWERTDLPLPREQNIADLVVAGADNARIASELHLSEATVRTHVTRVLTAHGVATRTGLLAALHDPQTTPVRPRDLTPRQCDVVALVAAGHSNTDIAGELGISPRSVETHLGAIRDRWQATSRFDVARRWWLLQSDGTEPDPARSEDPHP